MSAISEVFYESIQGFDFFRSLRNPKPTYFELNNFFRQFASIYDAGTNWLEAVSMMIEEVENQRLKEALQVIYRDMEDGISLAEAFSAHDMFPPFCIETLRAGQETDSMSAQLKEVGKFLKRRQQIQNWLTKAVRPIKIMAIVVVFCLYVITTMIVPKLEALYKDVNAEIPLFTVITMKVFSFFLEHLYIPILVILAMPYLWKWLKRRFPMAVSAAMFQLPLYKKVYYYEIQYLFAKLMSLFIKSGKNPTEAILLTADMIDNYKIRSMLHYVHYQIKEGENLATALTSENSSKLLSTISISFIKTSEATGQSDISQLLESAAEDFEDAGKEEMEKFSENLYSTGIALSMTIMAFILVSLYYPQIILFTKIG